VAANPPGHVFNPREFIGIRAGYADLYGGETSWDDLRADLSKFKLSEVLELLGRVSALLKTVNDDDGDVQAGIAVGLLGDGAQDLLKRLGEFAARCGNPRVVLFEPLQVASLAKAALMFLPADKELRPDLDLSAFVSALLRISDLIGPAEMKGLDTEEGRRAWATFLFATGVFYRGGSDLHDLARFHLLCLKPHEEFSTHPDYVDPSKVAADATGLPVHLLWLGMTALQSQWLSLDPKKAASGPVFIDEHTFLSSGFHFSNEEVDRIFAIAASDVAAIREAVRAQYRPEDFRPFDLVPLADKPLIRVGHRCFCPSVHLLVSKLGSGLYYLLANSLRGKDRDRFTRFLGHLFEVYVGRLLTRMFFRRAGVILDGETLRTAAGSEERRQTKTADYLLVVEGVALVIETKARFFSRAVRAGEDWDGLSARLDDIYSRGGRQLESAIELCERGALKVYGVDPAAVKAYVPVVVSLDETPLTPNIYDLLTPVLPAHGADRTVPLQVIGVSELEPLEAGGAARELNAEMLLLWKSASGKAADSLRNFVYQDPNLRQYSKLNPLLSAVYNEAMTDALRVLRLRQR
jgi:hypothetical protein